MHLAYTTKTWLTTPMSRSGESLECVRYPARDGAGQSEPEEKLVFMAMDRCSDASSSSHQLILQYRELYHDAVS